MVSRRSEASKATHRIFSNGRMITKEELDAMRERTVALRVIRERVTELLSRT